MFSQKRAGSCAEATALLQVADRLDERFVQVAEAVFRCRGRIVVTGIGKSADVAQKLVGTLNSTGTRSYLLDATRAVHGDLGMVHPDDAALVLSHSGESEELLRLLGPLQKTCARFSPLRVTRTERWRASRMPPFSTVPSRNAIRWRSHQARAPPS